MRLFFTVLFLSTLPISNLYPQKSGPHPVVTLKASLFYSAIHGVDFRSYDLDDSFFFQPAIGGGMVIKNRVYVGVLGSSYCCFKFDGAYGHKRTLIAGEFGYPIRGKHILGISIGQEDYIAPWLGFLPTEYKYQSILYGIIFDYRIHRFISIPVRVSITNDNSDYGIGTFWHFSLGISGNLPIPLKARSEPGKP